MVSKGETDQLQRCNQRLNSSQVENLSVQYLLHQISPNIKFESWDRILQLKAIRDCLTPAHTEMIRWAFGGKTLNLKKWKI